MAARSSKSKKGSGASSSSKPPPEVVLFIDKCLGRIDVPNALRAAGENVELLTDHFEQDEEDENWAREVGKRGWVILSKDERLRHNVMELAALRHNVIELAALLKSGTHSFLLTRQDLTGEEMGRAFVTALPQIKQIIAREQPPCICTVSPTGRVRLLVKHAGIIARIAR